MNKEMVITEVQDKVSTMRLFADELYNKSLEFEDNNIDIKIDEIEDICKKYEAMGITLY